MGGKFLATHGANLDAVTAPARSLGAVRHTGFSPAHLAALANNRGILEVIERGGGNLFQKAPGGYTPLDVAIEKHNGEVVRWLRSKSAQSQDEL